MSHKKKLLEKVEKGRSPLPSSLYTVLHCYCTNAHYIVVPCRKDAFCRFSNGFGLAFVNIQETLMDFHSPTPPAIIEEWGDIFVFGIWRSDDNDREDFHLQQVRIRNPQQVGRRELSAFTLLSLGTILEQNQKELLGCKETDWFQELFCQRRSCTSSRTFHTGIRREIRVESDRATQARSYHCRDRISLYSPLIGMACLYIRYWEEESNQKGALASCKTNREKAGKK